jgi:hypothetical protein
MSSPIPGRRSSGRRSTEAGEQTRRISPALALAVGVPLLTGLALVAQAPADTQREQASEAPAAQPLADQALACPASEAGTVVVASAAADDADGTVTWRAGSDSRHTDLALEPGGTAEIGSAEPDSAGPVLVQATDGLAPDLYAARFGPADQPSAGECTAAAGERWFVGIGSGGDHLSTLQLVNPDTGPAIADVTLWSTDGPLDEVESRGLTIEGGGSATLDLEKLAPHRHELAARVTVSRGRVVASVRDSYSEDGADASADWMAATRAPATSLLLPGLLRRADERVLTLVNTGDSEGRVTLQVVGARSTFAPRGIEEIRVPAGRVVVTDLTDQLAAAVRDEDAALLVTGTVPVAAGLRSVVAGDVVHQPALEPVAGRSAALVPPRGDSTLVVTAAGDAGSLDVTFVGADGAGPDVRLQSGISTALRVPAGTVAVIVDGGAPYVAAVRTLRPKGAALLSVRPLVADQLIAAVRPAWPPQSAR